MNIALIQPSVKQNWVKLSPVQVEWYKIQDMIYKKLIIKRKLSISSEGSSYSLATGLLILASIAKEMGYKVNYFDQDYLECTDLWEASLKEIARQTDLVAITAMTRIVKCAYSIIKNQKNLGSKSIFILGGPHVSFLPEEAVLNGVDIVVIGEGEYSWTKLLSLIKKKGEIDLSAVVSAVPNVFVKSVYSKISRELVDIDDIPLPAFDILAEFFRTKSEFYIFASRGCMN